MAANENKNVVELILSEDKLTASLIVHDFSLPTRDLLERIKLEIKKNNVSFGIDRNALKTLISEKQSGVKTVFAKGTSPQGGRPAGFEPLAELVTFNSEDCPEGRVPAEKLHPAAVVQSGTPLVRFFAARPGQSGTDVTGQEIEPPPPEEKQPLQLGDHVKTAADDEDVVVAAGGGLAVIRSDVLFVMPVLEIENSLDEETEPMVFPGKVVVHGDIKAGVELKAKGDLTVLGAVGDAVLEADGDIEIQQGFVGTMKGSLTAGRDIRLGSARNQKISAAHDIYFDVEMVSCQVWAGRMIKSEEGRIVGGKSEAQEKIIIKSAGSEESVPTILATGKKTPLFEMRNKTRQELQNYNQLVENVKSKIYELAAQKFDYGLSNEELQHLYSLQEDKAAFDREIDRLEKELAEILERIRTIDEARIQINGSCFPNVEVHIRGSRWKGQKRLTGVFFKAVESQIGVRKI